MDNERQDDGRQLTAWQKFAAECREDDRAAERRRRRDSYWAREQARDRVARLERGEGV